MKMAFIILPLISGGRQMVDIHRNVVEDLIKNFGGATMYDVTGFWRNDDRAIPCAKVECAMHDVPSEVSTFLSIGKDVADRMEVHSVMVQKPCGEIVFIEGDTDE